MINDLNYDTCTMEDVILKSCKMHPSLLIEALYRVANEHSDYALRNKDIMPAVSSTAKQLAEACIKACGYIGAHDAEKASKLILSDTHMTLVTFERAASLLLIPRVHHAKIVGRSLSSL